MSVLGRKEKGGLTKNAQGKMLVPYEWEEAVRKRQGWFWVDVICFEYLVSCVFVFRGRPVLLRIIECSQVGRCVRVLITMASRGHHIINRNVIAADGSCQHNVGVKVKRSIYIKFCVFVLLDGMCPVRSGGTRMNGYLVKTAKSVLGCGKKNVYNVGMGTGGGGHPTQRVGTWIVYVIVPLFSPGRCVRRGSCTRNADRLCVVSKITWVAQGK